MSNLRQWTLWATFTGGAVMFASLVRGQDDNSADFHYGDGVRAYFSGDCSRAEGSLSLALETHSQDPRVYYFRALSLLRLGRTAEARGDMLVGAALEAQQPNRYAVGKSLERVQGYNRLMLEQFRRQARAEARAQGPSNGLMQASEIDDARALRQRVVIPLDAYLQPGLPQHATTADDAARTPRTFAPAPAEAPRPDAAGDDPFRDDPQPLPAIPPIGTPAPSADGSPAAESDERTQPKAGGPHPNSGSREQDPEARSNAEADPFAD